MIIQIGQTVEANGLRFHRYAYAFRCEELANAGKRGKKVRRFDIYVNSCVEEQIKTVDAVTYYASDDATYDAALTTARRYTDRVQETVERGIDVEPASGSDNSEVTVSNDSMFCECSLRSFVVRDLVDRANEPTLIDVRKSDPAKLLKWLRANTDAARTMTFRQMWDTMTGLDIRAHYYCAVD